jgi:hypothetical protein
MKLPLSGLWFVVPMLAGAAWAQTTGAHKGHVGADVFGGYTYVSPDFGLYDRSSGESGVNAGVDLRFTRFLAAAVEVGFLNTRYNPKESSHTTTLLAGPRIFIPIGKGGRIAPFADVLGGISTFSDTIPSTFTSGHSGTLAADAGLDVRATRHLWIRAEGGFLHSNFTSDYTILQSSVHNQHGRMFVGAVWRF